MQVWCYNGTVGVCVIGTAINSKNSLIAEFTWHENGK
jgi:hypothetical protein